MKCFAMFPQYQNVLNNNESVGKRKSNTICEISMWCHMYIIIHIGTPDDELVGLDRMTFPQTSLDIIHFKYRIKSSCESLLNCVNEVTYKT